MTGIRYERTRREDQRLVAHECQSCGYVSYPDLRRICKRCGETPAEFEPVQLRERGTIQTYVVQQRLPEEFDTPQPVAIVDLPQVGDGEPARVYGLLTETDEDDLAVGTTVEARFRELFTDGSRPIHSFKFAIPRTEAAGIDGNEPATGGNDD